MAKNNVRESFKLHSTDGTILGMINNSKSLMKALDYLEASEIDLSSHKKIIDKFIRKFQTNISFVAFTKLLILLNYPMMFSKYKRIEEVLENQCEFEIEIGTRHRGIGDFVGERKNAGLNAGCCIKCPITN